MKKIRNIICCILAIAMIVCIVASCSKPTVDDDKEYLATYDDGQKVYEEDIENWKNYLFVYNYQKIVSDQMTKKEVVVQAISSYLLNRFLETELEKYGMAITDEELTMLVIEYKGDLERYFDETDSTTGVNYKGVDGWLDAYNVTEDFIEELVKFNTQEQLIGEYLKEKSTPSDAVLRAYYEANALNYATKAAYIFNIALIEVKDLQDSEEVNSARKETSDYIAKLKDGSITFEEVVSQVKEKYTTENGYSGMSVDISEVNSELDDITMSSYSRINDLDAYLAAVNETYASIMDAEADKDSDEYKEYLQYLLHVYRGKLLYILNKELTGVYSEPIEHPLGFAIIEFVKHRNSSWGSFEEQKEKILEDYLSSVISSDIASYEGDLLSQHSVVLGDFEIIED